MIRPTIELTFCWKWVLISLVARPRKRCGNFSVRLGSTFYRGLGAERLQAATSGGKSWRQQARRGRGGGRALAVATSRKDHSFRWQTTDRQSHMQKPRCEGTATSTLYWSWTYIYMLFIPERRNEKWCVDSFLLGVAFSAGLAFMLLNVHGGGMTC